LVDKNGFIMTDESCKTNIDGIYAVGPIRSTMVDDGRYHYQAYNANMAATDGAIAAINAIKYINS
jgi:thioredoxin reductase (NADPH)